MTINTTNTTMLKNKHHDKQKKEDSSTPSKLKIKKIKKKWLFTSQLK